MRPTKTRGETNCFKAPKNWDPEKDGECGDLSVRVEYYGERKLIQHVSTWKPSAADLEFLNNGGVIECMLVAAGQPPMALAVVEPVDAPAPKPEVPHIT